MPRSHHLERFNALFNPYLQDFFAQKQKETKNFSPIIKEVAQQIESLTISKGKRIRPALLFYSYHNLNDGSFESVKNYCLAIEIFHSFALIHDDIMDKAKLRRGRPTAVSYFNKKYKKDNLSISLGVLCGDLAFSWADELFYRDLTKQKISYQKLHTAYSEMKNEVIFGQLMDIVKVEKEKEILKMIQFKTASYTIEKPLLIGAILAGASKKQLDILTNFGQNVGLAFQIQDDILGVFGAGEKLGKSVYSDLKEGKMNLLAVKTLSKLNPADKKIFWQYWGNPDSFEKELSIVKNLMRQSGGLSDCLKLYTQLKKDAQNSLQNTILPLKLIELLKDLTDEILLLPNTA